MTVQCLGFTGGTALLFLLINLLADMINNPGSLYVLLKGNKLSNFTSVNHLKTVQQWKVQFPSIFDEHKCAAGS